MPLPPIIADWFAAKGWAPRRHQLDMLAAAERGESALLVAEGQQLPNDLLGELRRAETAVQQLEARVTQHVGLIWDASRVAGSHVETVAALNPQGGACQDQLRPGLAARFRFPGGLDLSVVSAHLKSKRDERAYLLRGRSFSALPSVATRLRQQFRDADVLLLGDWNTMGCDECSPPVTALQEQAEVRAQLAKAGLSLLPADAPGSYLRGRQSTLLDHAIVSGDMRELPFQARANIVGICAPGAPHGGGRAARFRRSLSDHCALVLDLIDRDLD